MQIKYPLLKLDRIYQKMFSVKLLCVRVFVWRCVQKCINPSDKILSRCYLWSPSVHQHCHNTLSRWRASTLKHLWNESVKERLLSVSSSLLVSLPPPPLTSHYWRKSYVLNYPIELQVHETLQGYSQCTMRDTLKTPHNVAEKLLGNSLGWGVGDKLHSYS